MKEILRKYKALIFGGIIALFFGVFILGERFIQGSWWVRGFGIILVLGVFYSIYQDITRREHFEKTLIAYVATYQIPLEQLGDITGFDKYDFQLSTKNQVSFIYSGNQKKTKQVLAALEKKYGKLTSEA
ncbi:hypothetical protein ACYSNU_14150 [Enterococcus sp. LJL120]